ncbi:MAG: hypothetical protein LBS12_07850 [Prevotellaceae bacterium]|jgi:hypothetical protein|nr:hypothetical protein [Prevotellaceae bacterium]
MKQIFLIAILFLSLTAFGQGVSVVRVVQLGADYAATPPTVEFRVYWDAATDSRHLDSVWVFVDYQPISSTGTVGEWIHARLTSPAATAPGTVIPVTGNSRGFYLRGTPAAGFTSTVTVALEGLTAGDKFNWCAYASDYPPNTTDGAGFYDLHGTTPFVVNGDTLGAGVRTFSDCIDTLTDATGCPGLVPAKPEITAFTPLFDTICAGDTVTLSATATGASEYSFDDGTTWQAGATASVAPTSDATYTVKVRNTAGCTVTAAVGAQLKVYSKPAVSFSVAPSTACAGNTVTVVAGGGSSYCFTHTCTACGRNPYSNGNDDPTDFDCFLDSDSCTFATSNSYTVTMPDSGSVTVCVQVMNEHGCIADSCITIACISAPYTIALLSSVDKINQTLCEGAAIADIIYETTGIMALSEMTISGLPPGVSPSWNNGTLTFSGTPEESGTYVFLAGSTCGAVQGRVTIHPNPAAPTLNAPAAVCHGTDLVFVASGYTGTLEWSASGGTADGASYTVSAGAATGSYMAKVRSVQTYTDGFPCYSPYTDDATGVVNIRPGVPAMGGGGVQCGGALNITAAAGTDGISIRWTDNDNTASPRSENTSGTYYAVSKSAGGCESDAASVTVTIHTVPQAIISGATINACPATTVTLTATATGATTYTWYKNSSQVQTGTGNSYTVTESGTYTVKASNANCTGSLSSNKVVTIGSCGIATSCTVGLYSMTPTQDIGTTYAIKYSNAVALCAGYGTGWRLPSRPEMQCLCGAYFWEDFDYYSEPLTYITNEEYSASPLAHRAIHPVDCMPYIVGLVSGAPTHFRILCVIPYY